MAEAPFVPPEEAVARLLERHTPRQLAVAYLRAVRRARESETAFVVLDGLYNATLAVVHGETAKVGDELEAVIKELRTAKEVGGG